MQNYQNRSDVAQTLQQIAQEYEAATNGISGFATGISRHAFITARMEAMSRHHEALKVIVGNELEAIQLVAQTLENLQQHNAMQ